MALQRDPIAFPKLDDAQIAALAQCGTLKTFQRQQALFAAGQCDFAFYVIKSMSHYLVRRIEQTPKIELRTQTEIVTLQGDKWLSTVDLRSSATGATETVVCAAVFVFIGAVPHSGWLPDTIQLTKGQRLTWQSFAPI